MKVEHSPDYLEGLLAEQAEVQSDKMQMRVLANYDQLLFPNAYWGDEYRGAVEKILCEEVEEGAASVAGVLSGMQRSRDRQVHWADMGAGHGFAQRELIAKHGAEQILRATGVDLFEYRDSDLLSEHRAKLLEICPDILGASVAPERVLADIQQVQLDAQADLITSVESIQYLDDPLGAISNWYNQLHDGGVISIASAHDFAGRIRYYDRQAEDSPTENMLRILGSAGVRFATSRGQALIHRSQVEKFHPGEFSNLVVVKCPGTHMSTTAAVVRVVPDQNDQKYVYYDAVDDIVSIT